MASRAQRLLRLLDALHRRRRPVPGAALAHELRVSLRTVYRDIATLREQGADIAGDPGIGYQMRPGFLLPPLMFGHDELEALVLGARWVQGQADTELAKAAEAALTRITATLPSSLRLAVDTSGLFAPRSGAKQAPEPWLPTLRRAIRDEEVLAMDYVDGDGRRTHRSVWPFAMAFFDRSTRLFAAWCELRRDFRHFRAERVVALAAAGRRYPVGRHLLIRRWREQDPMARGG
ncbi:MAG: helix-turn-helix transcriptional regulator [Lautropia sp.]